MLILGYFHVIILMKAKESIMQGNENQTVCFVYIYKKGKLAVLSAIKLN